MAYIPKIHLKYNLLPYCNKKGGEVFSYPSELLSKLEKYLPDGENMMPYGYNSYDEYYSEMDKLAKSYFREIEVLNLYAEFKNEMHRLNIKENWSVLRYIGKSHDSVGGLTNGNVYYWPCSIENPVYEGVIDDEEFTSYLYSTEASEWVILEDPTGMAYRTIYEHAKGYMSRKEHEYIINQLERKYQ